MVKIPQELDESSVGIYKKVSRGVVSIRAIQPSSLCKI
jgi:hypothetical protein